MSGEARLVQAAMVAALRANPHVAATATGVWDGAPAGAAFPYVEVAETVATDWSAKDFSGRELRVAVAVRDEPGRAARLHGLAEAAEAAIAGMPRELEGARVVGLLFVRSRIVRERRGNWAAVVEFRVRVTAV